MKASISMCILSVINAESFFDYYNVEAVQEYVSAVDQVEKNMNVKVNDVNINLYGICSHCKS